MAYPAVAVKGNGSGLRETFAWVRAETLLSLLVGVGLCLWLWILTYFAHPDDFWPGWGTLLVVLLLDAVCFFIRSRSFYVAAGLLTVALFGVATVFLTDPAQVAFGPFLFVPVVLIAGTLLGSRGSLSLALAASLVLTASELRVSNPLFQEITLGALAVVWFAAITMWATTRHLYITLAWAWENSTRADRNLDEARKYQAKLAAALRQIEEANYRLSQANHALDWARAEAESARQLKAQFAAHVSHELRTPINLVVGFAELVLNNPEAYGDIPIPPPYLPDLQALYRSTHLLQGLIDDILDLSQIDAGQMPLVKDLTEVNAVVQEAVATARPLLDRKGLDVVVELTSDLPMLNLDRLRIRQVLLNLLNNAARYTDSGTVTIRSFREGDDIIITVTDTGVGMRVDDIQQLFEEYHQLEPSVTRGRGGTGLGLAITRRFVELHHGRVWANSPGLGSGSTFGITLPIYVDCGDDLSVSPASAVGAPRRVSTAAHSAPSVIVLDDDPSVVSLFHRYLEGYHVVGAGSEDEAARLAARLGAHAMLVDLAEADHRASWHQNWLDVARRQRLRIVGCPMPSGRRLARTLGLADYLVKPVSRDGLLAAIHTVAPDARKICVIDDQPQMVNLLCRMLRTDSWRYEIVRAYNGSEGLEIIRRCQPDLVLLDVLMPEVGGLTVLEQMRDEPALATIPVIAVSARGAVEGIAPSAMRVVSVVHDSAMSVSRLLHTVQTILDNLPPARSLTEQAGEASIADQGGSAAF